ncbi:MAG: PglZ domain-containing protein, partial [Cyanobacteriota bacterium]
YKINFWQEWNKDSIKWLQFSNENIIPNFIIENLFQKIHVNYPVTQNEKNNHLTKLLGIDDKDTPLEISLERVYYPEQLWQNLNGENKEAFQSKWLAKLEKNYTSLINSNEKHPLFKNLCTIAYNYYKENPEKLDLKIIHKISIYLEGNEKENLEKLIPPSFPIEISKESLDIMECIEWCKTYNNYLYWDYQHNNSQNRNELLDQAIKFGDLFLNQYKILLTQELELSLPLNINVYYELQKLRKNSTVLWFIIDGLNYIDHEDLIKQLTFKNNFYLKADSKYLFSLLPSITEYSKKAMVTGYFPDDESINTLDIRESFYARNESETSFYAKDDNQNDLAKIYKEIKENDEDKFYLFCFDLLELDKVYHNYSLYKDIQKEKVKKTLKDIIEKIKSIVLKFNTPEKITIVISSDHGQIIDKFEKIELNLPKELLPKGCRAIEGNDFKGLTSKNLAILDALHYRLPKDYTIINDQGYFNIYNKNQEDNLAGGMHGSCFPEELLVGFSVLGYKQEGLIRTSLSIQEISGKGEFEKPGIVSITIFNSNNVSLVIQNIKIRHAKEKNLFLKIEQPETLLIKPMKKKTIDVSIESWPNASGTTNKIEIDVTIEYNFKDDTQLKSAKQNGYIEVQSLQTDEGIDLDEFF